MRRAVWGPGPSTAGVILVLITLVVGISGCGTEEPPGADLPNPVTGLITKVGKDHIVLKTKDGKTYRFDNADTDATASHLEEHRKHKLPVAVTHEPNGDRLIARRIEDSGG